MTTNARQNLVAWALILVFVLLFIRENAPGGHDAAPGAPEATIEVGMQQAILMKFVNGMKSPEIAGTLFEGQLLALNSQVPEPGDEENPGLELSNAALLARTGALEDIADTEGGPPRPGAVARLMTLSQRITDGEVEADQEFITLLHDVQGAVEATRAPGPQAISAASARRIEESLGVLGRTLSAQARADEEALRRLEAGGMVAISALILFMGAAILVGLGGMAVLGVFVVLAVLGKTRGAGPSARQWSHVYAEMFAVWLGAFFLLHRLPSLVLSLLHQFGLGSEDPFGTSPNLALTLGLLASVVAFVLAAWWGTRRGLSWRTVREGVALTPVRFSDLLWGIVCYAMGVALLACGLGISMLLSKFLTGGPPRAGHPIQQIVEEADGMGILLTFLVASVSAPLFEEFFFRGAMFRNLDDMFAGAGRLVSSCVAIGVSSVIFAAIHPQGFIFIPVLGSLAVAFCIMREWRGSINPGIVAHAINNSIMITLNIILLKS